MMRTIDSMAVRKKISNAEAVATQTLVPRMQDYRVWGIQCKGFKRNGERCLRYAIKGGYVCCKHGGQFPTVKGSAVSRLTRLADPALARLEDILLHGKPAEQLRAVRMVLKYSGITPQNIRSMEREGRRALESGQGAPGKAYDAEIESLLTLLTGTDDEE